MFVVRIAALWVACFAATWSAMLFAQDPQIRDVLPGAHKEDLHQLTVTHVTVSPDGERLLAAYFRSAQNRPGTDWAGWIAQWDLTTGRRILVHDTMGPVAFFPNGKRFVAAVYQRDRLSSHPNSELALWNFGERKPTGKLVQPMVEMKAVPHPKTGNYAAAAIHPAGDYLVAVNDLGRVLFWPLATKQAVFPTEVATVKLQLASYGWGSTAPTARLAFADEGKTLHLAALSPEFQPPRRIARRWQVEIGKDSLSLAPLESPKEDGVPLAREQVNQPPTFEGVDGKWRADVQADGVIEYVETGSGKKRTLRLDDEASAGIKK